MTAGNGHTSESTELMVAPRTFADDPIAVDQPSHSDSLAAILVRRWRTMLLATLLAATASVSAVWLLVKPKYEVSAIVHIAPLVRPILRDDHDTDITRLYSQYVATQAGIMLSSAVISNALDSEELRSRPTILKLQNPVEHIQDRLQAELVKGTQLLKVSMIGQDAEDMALIVNAVLDAYLRRVEHAKQAWDDKILTSLWSEQTKLDKQLKAKGSELQRQAGAGIVGSTSETETVTAADQWEAELRLLLVSARKDRAIAQANLRRIDESEGNDGTVWMDPDGFEEFLNNDPEWRELELHLRDVERSLANARRRGLGPGHRIVKTGPQQQKAIRERMAERKAELRAAYTELVRRKLQFEVKCAQITENTALEELKALVASRSENAVHDFLIEDLQHQRERLEDALSQVRDRIWTVQVEQNRMSRITVHSRARAPDAPNLDKRPKYSLAALFMSLCVGTGATLLRNRLDTRLRHPMDVPVRLGVPLLGSVQRVSGGAASVPALAAEITEPMRGICTALLAASDGRQSKTRLITSPTPGNGKSSLAMHLARCLASTGRRVLLVDGDNNGRGLTRELELADRPGLRDFLKDNLSPDDIVCPGDTPDLHVLPAGQRDERFGEYLGHRQAQERLRALFGTYEEVIVDSPPVLVSCNAITLATLVDSVILVVRAGTTTGHEAAAARQYLAGVGRDIFGVILNAVDPKIARYGYTYAHGYYDGRTQTSPATS